jgi:DNA (cytosine-5)-methyltransferase 1
MSRSSRRIEAVDLFCGVGGLSRGLVGAGIAVRLGVDIDPRCAFPMETNIGATFLEEDVFDLSAQKLNEAYSGDAVRLLAGCAPCQPFSTYSRSAKGERNSDWELVRRFGELVSDLQPDLVTMENVPPLADEPVFGDFLALLANYHVDWDILEAKKVGLPQTRQRLVLVASKLGPISFDFAEHPTSTVRDTISSLPPLQAGGCDQGDLMHCSSRLSPLNKRRIKASKPGGTWRDWPVELRAKCHLKKSGQTYPSVYGRMEWDQPSPTITTQCFGYGNGRFGHPEQDRAISLREAAMLQGFPRDYKFLPEGKRPNFASFGRLIGNAVPVSVGRAIGEIFVKHVSDLTRREIRSSFS